MIDHPRDGPTKRRIRHRANLRTVIPDLPAYYFGIGELPRSWRLLAYLAMVSPFLGLGLLAVVLALF